MTFEVVAEFEKKIAEFFGAPYAVAVDSCTHGLELCLRYAKAKYISCPRNTYLSVPMLANKLNIPLFWKHSELTWIDYYNVHSNIYDAAVLWKRNSYIPDTMMCISMQYQKHLSVGRLGVILVDTKERWLTLKKMSYDGRLPNVPWREQNIDSFGFHYYAQPELCSIALSKLHKAIDSVPRNWDCNDWPDLTNMTVFQNKYLKIYNQIIEKARREGRSKNKVIYYENHHIIPRCLGGSDLGDNRILLTAREHFVVHKLLCLIFPNEYKFKIALWRMVSKSNNQKRDYRITSREFDSAKKAMAITNSFIQIERWRDLELRAEQSIKISKAQTKSYIQDPNRVKRLSKGQIKSYQNSNRAQKLSCTQKSRYKDPQERMKTGVAIKKSKTPELLRKMSDRFSGKGSSAWKGYVYIYNSEGKLKYKFDTIKEANKTLGPVAIKHNRVGKKGKWKGYKFIISKIKK